MLTLWSWRSVQLSLTTIVTKDQQTRWWPRQKGILTTAWEFLVICEWHRAIQHLQASNFFFSWTPKKISPKQKTLWGKGNACGMAQILARRHLPSRTLSIQGLSILLPMCHQLSSAPLISAPQYFKGWGMADDSASQIAPIDLLTPGSSVALTALLQKPTSRPSNSLENVNSQSLPITKP